MSCNCGEADECDEEWRAMLAAAAAPRPAPAEPQGAEAPQEIKSLRDRIIEGELELDGTHPPTLMFLMAEHWKAVATEHYAKAKDYDRLKHELRLSRTATAPQPAGGEREAFEAWCSKRGQDYERLGDGYTNDLVQRTWQGWQARADLSQPAAQQDPVAWMWQHPDHVDLPRYLPEFKPSPPDAAKCRPAVPLTEEDVRRIVRDELAKGGA